MTEVETIKEYTDLAAIVWDMRAGGTEIMRLLDDSIERAAEDLVFQLVSRTSDRTWASSLTSASGSRQTSGDCCYQRAQQARKQLYIDLPGIFEHQLPCDVIDVSLARFEPSMSDVNDVRRRWRNAVIALEG